MDELPVWKRDPIGSAERGENPTALARMRSGFAVLGWSQFLPGYSLLLGVPKYRRLEDMPRDVRAIFLEDMGLLGEAVAKACNPRRVNYSVYGNTDPYVHAHVVPRYDWEPRERVVMPVWQYPPSMWTDAEYAFDEQKHAPMKSKIVDVLQDIIAGDKR
jgi:diadenosine tetraphosphate (Ap4A) HIT family hydrolase